MSTKIEWTDELIRRFLGNIEFRDGCWRWTAGKFTSGYAQFRIGTGKHRAHRLMYDLAVGEIPDGLCVCHHCDVRACVNPTHLFVGSHRDNAQDRESKGRGVCNLRPQRGENNGSAKLTRAEVRRLRILHSGGRSYETLADFFEISKSQVGNIVRGDSWV